MTLHENMVYQFDAPLLLGFGSIAHVKYYYAFDISKIFSALSSILKS